MKSGEYERNRAVDVCHIWGRPAAEEVGRMVDQIDFTRSKLADIASTAQGLPHKAGFAAEVLHAETYNLDAILKDHSNRAYTDRHPNTPLPRNDRTADIVITDGAGVIRKKVQLKYYQNGEKTLNAFRATDSSGTPYYKEADAFLGPSDQIGQVKASAQRTQQKNANTRPHVADAARDVEKKVASKLEYDGVESRELSLPDAKKIASGSKEGKELQRRIEAEYLKDSTFKHSLKAAKSAAAVTSIIAGTLNTIHCLKRVQNGEMSRAEAVKYILWNTSIAAGDAALKAGAATATVSIASRHIPNLYGGTAFQSGLATGALAGAAICAVDLAECLVLVAAGKMTMAELETRTGKNFLQTGAATLGSAIGAAIGAPAGPPGVLVGSFIGGMIASMATTIAIDNRIEAPYYDTLIAAAALVKVQDVMSQSTQYLAQAQQAFAVFQIGVERSDQAFSDQLRHIDDTHDAIHNAIEKI